MRKNTARRLIYLRGYFAAAMSTPPELACFVVRRNISYGA
jgi:hypothetical protein